MDTLFISHTGETPLGDIWVAASENGLAVVEFPGEAAAFVALIKARFKCQVEIAPERLADVTSQLREYAAGERRVFDIPIDWSVLTPYQQRVLRATADILYGETRTYKEIAMLLGNPRAARAVGRAEATNPMPIVLPCHRVVGTDHKLHGYGAGEGLKTKDWLLRLEGGLL